MLWNRHRYNADTDPTVHFDADPDPDRTQSLHILENQIFFYFYSQQFQSTLFYSIVHSRKSLNFWFSFTLDEMDKYLDPAPDQQALDADPDPAKLC